MTLYELITSTIDEYNRAELGYEELENLKPETPFFTGGQLDSLTLVTIIVEIEARTYEEFGVAVALADEKAMSEKSGPYTTIGRLVEFAEKRMEEPK